MKNIKILIVDDEPLAHKVLESYCEKIEYVTVVGNCYDGVSAINFINRMKVDAMLLDVQMPDLTGMELVESLRKNSPKIIFITAFTEYALQSFNFEQVIDYLHKPVRFARFIKAIERLKRQLVLEEQFTVEKEAKYIEDNTTRNNEFITLTDNKTVYKIHLQDITYIQSWGNYIKIFTTDDEVRVIRKTIKTMEIKLTSSQFLRIHKSYIVNSDMVTSIKGNQLFLNEITLPMGKSYALFAKKLITGN